MKEPLKCEQMLKFAKPSQSPSQLTSSLSVLNADNEEMENGGQIDPLTAC